MAEKGGAIFTRGAMQIVPTKETLKSITGAAVDFAPILVSEAGNFAIWVWRPGDQSTEVAADGDESDWIAPTHAPTGENGAWQNTVFSGGGTSGGLDGQTIEQLTWDSSTHDLDFATAPVKQIDLSADVTTQTFSNKPADGVYGLINLRIVKTASAGDIAWDGSVDFVNGIPDFAGMEVNDEMYVTLEVSDGSAVKLWTSRPQNYKYLNTTAHTILESEHGMLVELDNASDITLTIPAGLPQGHSQAFTQGGAGVITYSGDSGVSVATAGAGLKSNGQDSTQTLFHKGSDSWILSGDVSA